MAQNWKAGYSRYKSFFLNISDLYRKKRELQMFLEILLSLATVSFFGIFALRPTLLTISHLVVDIKSKRETVTVMDTKIKNLETAQQILDSETYRLSLLDSSVLDTPKPEIFARQIEGLSNKNSVKVLGISVGETVILGKAKEAKTSTELKPLPENSQAIVFSTNTTGSYQGLYSFLQDLENLRLSLKIDSYGLTSSKVEGQTLLTLVVSGRIPYLGNQETNLGNQETNQ
ncbi:MAG: hypothetical protein ABIJ85_03170 [bacterium]